MKRILLAVLMVTACHLLQAQSVHLVLKPQKNQTYRFKSVSGQNIMQTVNGVQQNTATDNTSVMSLKMIDENAGVMIAEVRFDSTVTNVNTMGTLVSINSVNEGSMASDEAGEVMSCIMNRLSKNPLYVKIDPSGKILQIINYKMLCEIVLKDTSLIKGEMAATLKTQINNAMNEKALLSQIEAFTGMLPGKEVKTGDSWEMYNALSSGGMDLQLNTTYHLAAIKENMAAIDAETVIKPQDNAKPLMFGGAVITYQNLNGVSKSKIQIETATGMIRTSTSKTHLTGNMDVSVSGMNLQIPLEIDGESTIISL